MAHVAPDIDVVVIGAGLAGLGAAHRLRELGMHAVVLEAAGRIGGRAWTDHPPALGGAWFDMGAVWLHAAEQNPLAAIAEVRRRGADRLGRAAPGADLCRLASGDARRADRLHAMPGPASRRRPSACCTPCRTPAWIMSRGICPDDPWALTVESWEGPVICTADADRFSLRDWRRNGLSGANLMIEGGIGAFVQRRLGEGLTIRLETPVTRVRWAGSGWRASAVETAQRHDRRRRLHRHRLDRRACARARSRSTRRCRPRSRTACTRCRWASR